MKKDTFKTAHELNERILALQEQLETWERAVDFNTGGLGLKSNQSVSMVVDTSFMPFTVIKFMMIGVLNMELKSLQSQFEAL
jgi:hypothetical protein